MSVRPITAEPRVLVLILAGGEGKRLAPLTADVVAAMVAGDTISHNLTQFRPDRF